MKKSVAYFCAVTACFSVSLSSFAEFYGAELCQTQGYRCVKVKQGKTWDSLFPNLREREIVRRLNRTNMPLYLRNWVIVPENLKEITHMDIAPFKFNIDTNGKRVVIVDLGLHAFGAYDENGELQHWGPVSGGKGLCDDGSDCGTVLGEFTIQRKDNEECISGTFPKDTKGGAPMPYCMFFHRGFAMHGSTLPGHHASHGCVRLFYGDAKWLNRHFAKVGTKVIVTQ